LTIETVSLVSARLSEPLMVRVRVFNSAHDWNPGVVNATRRGFSSGSGPAAAVAADEPGPGTAL
jgi:hypothetical protein